MDRNTLKVKCEKCGHVNMLEGLAAWSAIILGCVCEECGHMTKTH